LQGRARRPPFPNLKRPDRYYHCPDSARASRISVNNQNPPAISSPGPTNKTIWGPPYVDHPKKTPPPTPVIRPANKMRTMRGGSRRKSITEIIRNRSDGVECTLTSDSIVSRPVKDRETAKQISQMKMRQKNPGRDNKDFVVYCFSDPQHASSFRAAFDGCHFQ